MHNTGTAVKAFLEIMETITMCALAAMRGSSIGLPSEEPHYLVNGQSGGPHAVRPRTRTLRARNQGTCNAAVSTTNALGAYAFPNLLSGNYELTVSSSGANVAFRLNMRTLSGIH